jgi:hypothetical protein
VRRQRLVCARRRRHFCAAAVNGGDQVSRRAEDAARKRFEYPENLRGLVTSLAAAQGAASAAAATVAARQRQRATGEERTGLLGQAPNYLQSRTCCQEFKMNSKGGVGSPVTFSGRWAPQFQSACFRPFWDCEYTAGGKRGGGRLG